MQQFVKINEKDNVAVALEDLERGEQLPAGNKTVTLCDTIARGHKLALADIQKGEAVVKYGFPIGYAKERINEGAHVHVHNLKTGLGDELNYQYHPALREQSPDSEGSPGGKAFFMGYDRGKEGVGVRNELWIIPTVGCVNSVAKAIAAGCQALVRENIEAVVAFSHPYGCSQMGDDQENTRIALADLIHHPNAGGVLVLGLGCENSNIGVIKEYIGEYDASRVRFLQCQDCEDEIEEGVRIMNELAAYAAGLHRTRIDADRLIIGLKCGGSDGLSGITANPVVGRFSDLLTQAGGSTILTEVPEMFGAETILMDRAADREVFDKTVQLINDFKDYFRSYNQTIYENPSPGNKEGGISTLEDKALGCTQKSGDAKVVDVLKYGQRARKPGLNLLSAPGNDLVASTALALCGAQIVLFTTGRGTPFACAVPTVKISSNTQLAEKKKNWIDFDCGRLLNEGMSLDILGNELYEYVLSVANGAFVKSEAEGYRDLAILKQGVTL